MTKRDDKASNSTSRGRDKAFSKSTGKSRSTNHHSEAAGNGEKKHFSNDTDRSKTQRSYSRDVAAPRTDNRSERPRFDERESSSADRPARRFENNSSERPARRFDGNSLERPARRFESRDGGNDRPFRNQEREQGGERRFGGNSERPARRFDRDSSDRPARRFDSNSSDRPARSFDNRGGDDRKSYRKPEGDRGFDRPARRFDNDSSENRPARRFDRDSSERPARRFDSNSSDRPARSFDNRGGDDRKSYRKSEGDNGYDRPARRFDGDSSENRPSRRFDSNSSERPARRFDNDDHGDRRPSRGGDKDHGYNRDRKPSGEYSSNLKPRRRDINAESEILSEIVATRRETGRLSSNKQQVLSLKWEEENRPIRLNKYISNSGICSRREADRLIETGAILVNDKIVTELGTKVFPTDIVRFEDKILNREKPVYIILNKPKDYITTLEDERGRKNVMELIAGACRERVYPVGRLDRNTTGLLLFTNDGEMAKKLTHPKFGIRKIYQVELDKALSFNDMQTIADGLQIDDDVFIKPDDIAYASTESKKVVGIEIHSGQNRIVRRIFESLGYEVVKLDRTVYAGLTKKDLPRGRWRILSKEEIGMLKMTVS
jgi:23S rRNA pseudouridine2605 synthase